MTEPFEAPAPGDPRSTGPRPRAGVRDLAWAALACSVTLLTVWQLARLVVVAATDPDVAPSGGMLLVAFVVTVVWLLTVFWLAMGAWRRTVWGCPFDHVESAPRLRRCPRHVLLPDAGSGTTSRIAGLDPGDGR